MSEDNRERRARAKYVAQQAKRQAEELRQIEVWEWPELLMMDEQPAQVWRSSRYLVLIYLTDDPNVQRVGVLRSDGIGKDGDWLDGITWDDLQAVKAAIGRQESFAIEVFPPQSEVVNTANIRWLWVFRTPPAIAAVCSFKGKGPNDVE